MGRRGCARSVRILVCGLWLSAAACRSAAPADRSGAKAAERHFGAPFSIAGAPTQVAEILQTPDSFLSEKVKCTGQVARVCQSMGCWLELRADPKGPGLRVPMAGHAFFVPQDIAGHTAVVEGVLSRTELTDAQLAHLKGEGLQATGPLFLEATSVLVR